MLHHSLDEYFVSPEHMDARLQEARFRILRVIQFQQIPLAGKGLCHVIEIPEATSVVEHLVRLIDKQDGSKARRVRRQRQQSLPHAELGRIRIPQATKVRRSALYGFDDIPPWAFASEYFTLSALRKFMEDVRVLIIKSALEQMLLINELIILEGFVYVPVSTMDRHRLGDRRHRRRSKRDQRPFHGRPNRDRIR